MMKLLNSESVILNGEMSMGRCNYCNEKIRVGESFILEGQYPGLGQRIFAPASFGPEIFGTVYHRNCFYETAMPSAHAPESPLEPIVREGKIRKLCPKCGKDFPKGFRSCPYCGGE